MKRCVLLVALMTLAVSFAMSQQWSLAWKMTETPYLTLTDITEMGMVKAGFDTDKDGWGEIICTWTDLDTCAILMYEASANNTYTLVWSYVFPYNSSNSMSFSGIAVGDLNNNGIPEIVTTMPPKVDVTPNPLRVFVFEWNGVVGQNAYGFYDSTNHVYTPSSGWNYEAADGYYLPAYSLTIEDIDKDGKNELITGFRGAGPSSNSREIVVSSIEGEYDGFASWTLEWKYANTFGGSNYSTTTGDLDGDGNREIYMFIWNYFTLRIFECTGDKQFTQVVAIDEMTRAQGVDHGALDAVRVADVNKDGVNEMYIACTEPGNEVYIVTGVTDVSKMTAANIKRLYTIPKTGGGKFRSMYIADPDKDGKTDLMIGGEMNGQIFSLEYKGSGDPADSASWQHQILWDIWKESGSDGISPRLFYGHPASDMDKDGKDEYAFVNYAPDFDVWPGDSPLFVIEIDVASDVSSDPSTIPDQVQLMQNYPNPFNPATTIQFQLPSESRVQLNVYDVLGREVATLVDGAHSAGTHTVRFDASNLTSGVYMYRLQVRPLSGGQESVLARKLVLVR